MPAFRLPARTLSASMALGMVACLSWATPLPAQATEGWDPNVVISSAAPRQRCADFLFVGIRGSGEPNGMGETVEAFRDGLKQQWKREGSVRQVWLDYPAVAPQTLGDVPMERLLFDRPMPSTKYFDSAASGAASLVRVLDDQMKRCPQERSVLVGFSQGAQVITSALATVRPGDALLAAVLLGNPSHYPGQNVREISGDAPLNAIGMGAYLTLVRDIGAKAPDRQKAVEGMLKTTFDLHEGKVEPQGISTAMAAVGAEIPPESYPATYSVCLKGDMVCDAAKPMAEILVSASDLTREMNRTRPIHLSYKDQNVKQTVDAVAGVINKAQFDRTVTPQPLPGPFRTVQLPARPDWFVAAMVGLGALVTGFIAGLLRGRSLGRRSATAAFRKKLEEMEREEQEPDRES